MFGVFFAKAWQIPNFSLPDILNSAFFKQTIYDGEKNFVKIHLPDSYTWPRLSGNGIYWKPGKQAFKILHFSELNLEENLTKIHLPDYQFYLSFWPMKYIKPCMAQHISWVASEKPFLYQWYYVGTCTSMCIMCAYWVWTHYHVEPRTNGHHFAHNTFKCLFLNKKLELKTSLTWLKFYSYLESPNDNYSIKSALVLVISFCQTGDKPLSLSEPMLTKIWDTNWHCSVPNELLNFVIHA